MARKKKTTLILFVLHTVFGFGLERLLRFFREMATARRSRGTMWKGWRVKNERLDRQ